MATETPEPKKTTPNAWGKVCKEEIPEGHPTQEHREFHPLDQKLRAAGFRIEHRPAKAEARWSRRGDGEMGQARAVELMVGEELAKKE